MSVRVGINGFGRIGRNVFRAAALGDSDVEIVAVNDITDTGTLAHLLDYDSVLRPLSRATCTRTTTTCTSTTATSRCFAERDPAKLPWGDLGVDVVIESTGFFTERDKAAAHLDGGRQEGHHLGARQGPGHHGLPRRQRRRSTTPRRTTSSPTRRAPRTASRRWPRSCMDAFGVEQRLHDHRATRTPATSACSTLPHNDLRRARSAALSIIPTSTGAARAIGEVLPEMKGKLDGIALRVPTPDGSVVDLDGRGRPRDHRRGGQRRVPQGAPRPARWRASSATPRTRSSRATSSATRARRCSTPASRWSAGRTVKLISWYDNEWGYSCRVVDLAAVLAS